MIWKAIGIIVLSVTAVAASAPQEPEFVVYKEVGGISLRLHVFRPAEKADAPAPAIVFFFGGGWTGGTPTQFYEQCRHFASRGMVAMSAEYRVKSRDGVSPVECVKDAKSAIRWVRAHAKELGVAPDKIVAGGGSAGGHLAACTAVIDGFEEENEDASVSSRPNALVLFNPAVEIPDMPRLRLRFGDKTEALSPLAHVKPGEPPTIVFHGTADTTVPFASVERFQKAMRDAGNVCELKAFEGKKHGFFNYARDKAACEETVREADAFLVVQRFLRPPAAPSGDVESKK